MSDNFSIALTGVEDLQRWLKEFPPQVETKVMDRGLRKAAARLRTLMRRRAPRGLKDELRAAITVMKLKRGNKGYRVGLNKLFYYGVLDKGRKPYRRQSGAQYAGTPVFNTKGTGIGETWSSHRATIAQMVIDEAKIALAREAGRLYGRSLRR